MKNGLFLVPALAFLAACQTGPSADRPVSSNTVVTDVSADMSSIVGRYDPASFTPKNARKMAAFSCENQVLASFGETTVDGQTVFTATCRDGMKYGKGSGVNFYKTGPNQAQYSAIHSLSGQITIEEGDFSY